MSSPIEQLAALTDIDWAGANPLSPAFRDNPYPALNALREKDPVNKTPIGPWRICRYADISMVFKSAPTSMTLSDGTNPNFDPLDRRGSFLEFMLNKDGSEHMRLRRLVVKAFTRRALEHMQREIDDAVREALDRALANGGMEVIGELALYLPSQMICRIIGIPEADRLRFTDWTAARTNAFFAAFLPEEVKDNVRAAGEGMADYFEDLVKDRRQHMGEDLLSELIRAEEDGDRLDADELIVQVIGLLVAGFETTIGLIGNGIRTLVNHPAQLHRLQNNLGLLDNAVEECLRFDPPVLFNWRILTESYEIGGKTLPSDSVLWMMLGAGNRDPMKFNKPDEFDIGRKNPQHLSFGGGTHFCLGHQLARMEARTALGEFARRIKNPEIIESEVEWSMSFFRVLGRLPISVNK
ncbi:MAG: cytochrome P450 [Gammaproteobacteria bacterium]